MLREKASLPLAAENIEVLLEVDAMGTKADAFLHNAVQATAAAASSLTELRGRRMRREFMIVSFMQQVAVEF